MIELPSEFYATFSFLLGACLGSFANVVIYRLPANESVVRPRSRCPKCKNPIAWYDNIPIFSWIILRGRCRKCSERISIRYPLVELVMGLTFLFLYLKVGLSWTLLEYWIFAFGLITAGVIDIDHMILPDEFTLSGIVIGVLGAWLNPERQFMPAFWGVLLGGGFLWAVAAIYLTLRKKEGMGGGDIKLLAWIGAVLGWKAVPFVILFSSLIGTIVGVFLLTRAKKGLSHAIPFGPYLALAALGYIFFGQQIAEMYIRFFIPSL